MLAATIELSRAVKLDWIKPIWRIYKPTDVALVGDTTFVRISPSQYTLNSLLAYANEDVQSGMEQQSVVLSKGLKSLIAQRNEQQSAELKQEQSETACSLFKTPPKQSKFVRSHAEKADLRKEPDVMCMNVVVDGKDVQVDVLRPVHPCDNLFVVYEPTALAAVIHIMRTMGFDEPQKRD